MVTVYFVAPGSSYSRVLCKDFDRAPRESALRDWRRDHRDWLEVGQVDHSMRLVCWDGPADVRADLESAALYAGVELHYEE